MKQRVLRLLPWILPPLFFLFIYQYGLRSWFQQDDFAWLQQWLWYDSWRDLPRLLFVPQAQGTIRPWSERAFFLAGYGLFGLDPRPMHFLVGLTQVGSLWMLASLARRLTGSAVAAVAAPMIWIINPGLATPVSWLSTYNQVLCTFFLLASLLLFIRACERKSLASHLVAFAIFLLGFGALEIHVVFPALALTWCLLYAPQHWRRTLPYWAVSVCYAVLHQSVTVHPDSGPYARYWTLEIVQTLTRYFGTTLAGGQTLPHWRLPAWAWEPPAWVAGLTLIGLAVYAWRQGQRTAAFGLIWFFLTIAPVLPLRDHFSVYYLAGPSLGVALAVAALLGGGVRLMALAGAAVLLIQLVFAYPVTKTISRWHFERGQKLRVLYEGLERAGELHPGKTILLSGMDTESYWGGFFDGPHKLLGMQNVLLVPGSEANIEAHPELGDMGPTIASRPAAARDVLWRRAVVYRIEERAMRNITSEYARSLPAEWLSIHPPWIDAGSASSSKHLGPGWYEADGGARWMGKRAAVELSGPDAAASKLRLAGFVPEVCVREGPLRLTVTAGGMALGEGIITLENLSFEFLFPIPPGLKGKPVVKIEIECSRTYLEPASKRELGVTFGQIGWLAR